MFIQVTTNGEAKIKTNININSICCVLTQYDETRIFEAGQTDGSFWVVSESEEEVMQLIEQAEMRKIKAFASAMQQLIERR